MVTLQKQGIVLGANNDMEHDDIPRKKSFAGEAIASWWWLFCVCEE